MVKKRYMQTGIVGGNKTTHSLRHSAITNAIRRRFLTGAVDGAAYQFRYHVELFSSGGTDGEPG